ncbi:type VII secretion target [Streptomyces sp. NPDC046862]|uniref:type VII secretion target n=1 Tax=Streptomyces sp. NPDC046862 TaxID=3154603 RepID=UPI0034533141
MGFRVQADDLTSYASQVGRAADDMQHARKYAQDNSDVGISNQGLIELIIGAHRSVVDEVNSAMTRAESVLRAAETELSKSATYYGNTDTATARSMDATYPPSKR